MLVNIIQNTISSFISAGVAASGVITTNLKMWLGFETSETLGRELNDLTWVDNGGWSINGDIASNDGSGSTLTNAILQVGNTYEFKCKLSSYTSGDFRLMLGSNTISTNFSSTDEFTFIGVCTGDGDARVQSLSGIGSLSISSLSIKELTQITPDKSGNNNVGDLFTGKALYFDGTTFYLDVSGFSMSGNNATFSFWANIEDIIKGDYFFDFHSSTTRFILGFGQTSKKLAVYSGGWHDFGDPPQDQWVRIVLTVKGTIAKCFVDGVQLGTDKTISTYDFSSPTTAHIGARYFPETIPKYYEGLLSDFQVYDKVWLNDDIAYDYANPQNLVTDRDNTTIALSNLKAYWAMSEGAGSLAYDSSGEGNNGTINGATYVDVQPRIPQLGMMNWAKSTPVSDEITLIPNPNNTSQDIFGNAVRDRLNSFNLGKFGGARVDDITISGNQATFQLWFKNVNSNDSLYLADIHSATDRIVLGFNSSQLSVYHEITGSWQNFGAITDGDWNFATFTFDGTALKCFVGTSQLGVTKTINAINLGTTEQFGVGMNHYFPTRTQDYNGHISDFLLYDRVLTSTEVENNYNAGLSAHTN